MVFVFTIATTTTHFIWTKKFRRNIYFGLVGESDINLSEVSPSSKVFVGKELDITGFKILYLEQKN